MQTIVMDDRGVRLSVSSSVYHAAQLSFIVQGHSVQLLPNHFGLSVTVLVETETTLAYMRRNQHRKRVSSFSQNQDQNYAHF